MPSLPGTVMTRLSPSIDHLGAGDAETVDAGADDLLRLGQRFAGGRRSVGGAGGQGDAGSALQVDAQLGLGLLVPGQEHQQIRADEQNQKKRQVAVGVHRRRRRCHVLGSPQIGTSARKGYVVALSAQPSVFGEPVGVGLRLGPGAGWSSSSASSTPRRRRRRPRTRRRRSSSASIAVFLDGQLHPLVTTTPGAISRSTLRSVMPAMVPYRPAVVVISVADGQRVVQVDGGLHGLLLAAGREEHERAHDDEQREEYDEFHGSTVFRVGLAVTAPGTDAVTGQPRRGPVCHHAAD